MAGIDYQKMYNRVGINWPFLIKHSNLLKNIIVHTIFLFGMAQLIISSMGSLIAFVLCGKLSYFLQ